MVDVSIGYRLEKAGYIDIDDQSGPYSISSGGTATLIGNGATLDLNFLTGVLDGRITFTRAGSATFTGSNGLIQTAGTNVARFDYDPVTLAARGLLVEPARTNSQRNSGFTGAVPGSPGTLPTNVSTILSGLTQEVVGSGTEDGIGYFDVRFTGTGASGTTGVRLDTANAVAATVGQTWQFSGFTKIVAGGMTGITQIRHQLIERNAGTSFVGATSALVTPGASGDRLVTCRRNASLTTAQATTAFVHQELILNQAASGAIDITLRLGGSQLELGAFPTSYIPTAGASATRPIDVPIMTGANFSDWYNQSEGTWYVEAESIRPNGDFPVALQAQNATNTERNQVFLRMLASTVNGGMLVRAGDVEQVNNNAASAPRNTVARIAFAYATNNCAVVTNGGTASTDVLAVMPTLCDRMYIGSASSGASQIWVRRIRYWNKRLSNAQLQALTA